MIAFYDTSDDNHLHALKLAEELETGKFGAQIISDYIFDETITLLKKNIGNKKATEIGDYLISRLELFKVDAQVFAGAWVLSKRLEKLSFTDCSNITLMKHHTIEYLAAFDSDFEGIVPVLR